MKSVLKAVEGASANVRYGYDTAKHVGLLFNRVAGSPFTGICTVCNNLHPEGHENTFGRERGFFQSWHEESTITARRQLADVPTLEIEGIKAADLLEWKENGENGRSRRNCPYCRFLLTVLDQYFPQWSSVTRHPGELTVMIRDNSPLIIACSRFVPDTTWLTARIDLEVYRSFEDGSSTREQNRLPGWPALGQAKERSADSGSKECFDFLSDCMSECTEFHQEVDELPSSFVPTRLLSIGSESAEIKLLDPVEHNQPVKWAALSHCWGGSHPLSLTKSTQQQRKRGISPDELPATFRDAVRVARHLKLEYIWIDSLCIIQDSREDWDAEAATMGDIYHHAVVVIAAASSPNPQTPFLGSRSKLWHPVPFTFQRADGSRYTLSTRRRHLLAAPLEQSLSEPPFTDSWSTLPRIGPLYSRAWCFQESFLAKRILHYSPGAIIFECQTHRRSEEQLPPYVSTVEGTFEVKTQQEKWHAIVKSYTSRSLTYEKDKLPAISGIAATMAQSSGHEYVAGLWRNTLPIDLLWHLKTGRAKSVLTFPNYIAPSWSWASINRGVVWNPLKHPKPLITILDIHCPPSGKNSFGEISTSASLTLRGPLAPIRICAIDTTDVEPNRAYYISNRGKASSQKFFISDGLLVQDMVKDKAGDQQKTVRRAQAGEWHDASMDAPAWFLCVASTAWTNYNHVGLLLGLSLTQSGAYERLGAISNMPKDWLERCEETVVTIM